jgi:hypothetical protein
MGSFTDYFKPKLKSSWCEMLTSSRLHLWSEDGITWRTPEYSSERLGGSVRAFPVR